MGLGLRGNGAGNCITMNYWATTSTIDFERFTNYATDASNSGFGNVNNIPASDIEV